MGARSEMSKFIKKGFGSPLWECLLRVITLLIKYTYVPFPRAKFSWRSYGWHTNAHVSLSGQQSSLCPVTSLWKDAVVYRNSVNVTGSPIADCSPLDHDRAALAKFTSCEVNFFWFFDAKISVVNCTTAAFLLEQFWPISRKQEHCEKEPLDCNGVRYSSFL